MGEIVRQTDPIAEALKSPKVDDFLMTLYVFEGRKIGPEGEEPKVGLLVEVESSDIELAGVLSKGERYQLLVVHFSEIPALVNNPKVKNVGWGDPDLVSLVESANGEEIIIKAPWNGPEGDEWDSAAYDNFRSGAEQNLGKRIQTLQKIGKKVKIQ